MLCPCCSTLEYDICCKPYIEGERYPPTPETLMRSRYTAFFLKKVDYIEKTMRGKALEAFDRKSFEQNMKETDWVSLEVQEVNDMGSTSTVEFIAIYQKEDLKGKLHELSLFHKIDGKWYYVSDMILR